MYFYRAFFKDGSVDYFMTTFSARRPKVIDDECIRLNHVSFLHYLVAKLFHFGS